MLSRSFTFIALSLALMAKVNGHAVVSPALGVQGAPVRADAQRTGAKPCGRMNVAQNLDSSQTITPNADGSITMTINNFNPGLDGSRQIRKAQLDTTGSGNFDTPVTVTTNGDPRPATRTGNEQITVQMPAGAKCTGGASGDLCVMSFTTLSGFGNCVVVKQANGGTATGTGTGTTGTTGTGTGTGTTGTTGTGTGTGTTGTGETGTGTTGTTGTGSTGTTGTGETGTGTTGTTGTGSTGTTGTGSTGTTGTGETGTGTTGTTGTGSTGTTGTGETGTGSTGTTGTGSTGTGSTGTGSTGTGSTGTGSTGTGSTGTTGTGGQGSTIGAGTTGNQARAIGGSRAPRALIHGFLEVQ